MLSIAIAVAFAALVLTVAVRAVEPRVAFFPALGETVTPLDYGAPFEAATVDTRDGQRVRVWTLTHPRPRALIVYFHGNGGNLSVWAPILADIEQRGYTVFAFDYRGYGLSTGRPTEKGLYRDVDAVLEYAWQARAAGVPVVYWGRSLGTTMAAYAATLRAPHGVILEAGFPDARSLVRSWPPLRVVSWLSSYRFPTASYMQRVAAPTLVLHGDRDSVVPYALGRKVYESIPAPKQFFTVRGGDHNDVTPREAAAYWKAVDAFVRPMTDVAG